MFRKSMPLALVVLAGCVGLVPSTTKPDGAQTPSGNPTDQNAQKGSSSPAPTQPPKATPTPVPTPVPTPTPSPTPLPKSILQTMFYPVEGVPGLEQGGFNGTMNNDGRDSSFGLANFRLAIAHSDLGDMYLQTNIFPSTQVLSFLCPICDTDTDTVLGNIGIFKKTKEMDEFSFVAMGEKRKSTVSEKSYYGAYDMRDFAFSKLTEVASVSVSWVVKGVDVAKKEVTFDTTVWPKNTGSLKLSDVATGDFFGLDDDSSNEEAPDAEKEPCKDTACENDRALTVVRQRTAFTGTAAYFIGRGKASDRTSSATIFRVRETGEKEIVGKGITEYFLQKHATTIAWKVIVYHFVYSQSDAKFYIIARRIPSANREFYRVSESALVP